MITYLYNHVAWFRNQINRINFNNQSKPDKLAGCIEKFVDSNGLRHYQYENDFDMPTIRFTKLQEYVLELASGFTGSEIDTFLNAMESQLEDVMNQHAESGKIKGIATVIHLIKEAQLRKKVLIRQDILFGMAGCLYIREDQDPAVWDDDIERQKITQFEKDAKTGLYDFFLKAGLTTYIPYLKDMKKGFDQYLKSIEATIKAHNLQTDSFISEAKSSKSSEPILAN